MRFALLLLTALPAICACGSLVGVPSRDDASDDGSNDPSHAPSDSNAPTASSSSSLPSPGSTSTTPPPAPTPAKLVFVTSQAFAGTDPALGTHTSANALCSALATTAGFGGRTFAAWLSDGFASASDANVIKAGVRYARPDGVTIATDVVAAMKSKTSFSNAIAIDEQLHAHSGSVWTFTTDDGSIGDTCSSSASDYATNTGENDKPPPVGTPGAITTDPHAWTEAGSSDSCDEKKPIYCFEQ